MSAESSYEIGKDNLVQDIVDRVIAAFSDSLKASPEMWDAIMEAIPYVPYRSSFFIGYSASPIRIDVVRVNDEYITLEFRSPTNLLLMELRIRP